MTLQDCILFANENPLCFLATAEGDQPRVRALGFWFADETGFYFQTAAMKEFPHQLEQNPKTEACFYKHDGMIGTMLRVSGTVEFVDTKALREKVFSDRAFLKTMGVSEDSQLLVLFRIAHGQAHFWTMENNLRPKEFIQF